MTPLHFFETSNGFLTFWILRSGSVWPSSSWSGRLAYIYIRQKAPAGGLCFLERRSEKTNGFCFSTTNTRKLIKPMVFFNTYCALILSLPPMWIPFFWKYAFGVYIYTKNHGAGSSKPEMVDRNLPKTLEGSPKSKRSPGPSGRDWTVPLGWPYNSNGFRFSGPFITPIACPIHSKTVIKQIVFGVLAPQSV